MARSSIGGTLRAERLRQKKELVTIEAATKISCEMLHDIENDRFDRLPPGIYRQSFLRQYARALALDEQETLAAFRQQYADPPPPLPAPPPARPRPWLHGTASLVIGISGCVGLYKYAESRASDSAISSVPARIVSQPQPEPEPAPAPAPVRVSETTASAPLLVGFTAAEPVWLSVKCDGAPTFTGTLLESANRMFSAAQSVTVLIGNAGGLTISVNGRPLESLGRRGEIQLIELTPSGARRLPRRI